MMLGIAKSNASKHEAAFSAVGDAAMMLGLKGPGGWRKRMTKAAG
jgi:hypothetical protein